MAKLAQGEKLELDAVTLQAQLVDVVHFVGVNLKRLHEKEILPDEAAQADRFFARNLAMTLFGTHPYVESKLPFKGTILLEQIIEHHPEVFESRPVPSVLTEGEQIRILEMVVVTGFLSATYELYRRWMAVDPKDFRQEAFEEDERRLAESWALILTGAPRKIRAS